MASVSCLSQVAAGSKGNAAAAATGGRQAGAASVPRCNPITRIGSTLAAALRWPHLRQNISSTAIAADTTNATTQSSSDKFDSCDWANFLRGYKSQYTERSYWIEDSMVEGTIPAELEGTLLRNGPGLFEVGGKQIPQPFDGDGMLATFAFKDGKAFFANRYVRTKGFVEEQQAGRLLYRGAFSVGNPTGGWLYNPFDLSVKGIANTGVVHWAGKLLALYERDLPYELSTPDLRTVGQTVTVPSQEPYFGAHYRITTEADGQRRLVAFNAAEVGNDNRINMFEYDENMQLLHRTEFTLPGAAFGFFHDFAVTENYYVFLESPMRLDLWKMATQYMLGKACIAECIIYDGQNKRTKVHLIPRPGKAMAGSVSSPSSSSDNSGRLVFETEPFFSFHHANAFEVAAADATTAATSASSLVVIDTVANHDGVDFSANFETGPVYYETDNGRGTLTRLVVDLQERHPLLGLGLRSGKVTQHRLMDRSCEFPSVSPTGKGHMYMVGSRFPTADAWGAPQTVVKVSLPPAAGVLQACSKETVEADVYLPGREAYAQEPIFVPRPGAQAEDDGWVLALVFDGAEERTRLVILDARQLSAGPVATINLPHMLPMGLHGSWTGTYLGPQPGSAHEPTEYDIRRGALRYS